MIGGATGWRLSVRSIDTESVMEHSLARMYSLHYGIVVEILSCFVGVFLEVPLGYDIYLVGKIRQFFIEGVMVRNIDVL